MRKLISILLLSIFVYYSIGFVFIFKLCQIYIKCEAKELLWELSSDNAESTVVLKLNNKQFSQVNWIEEDEFFYDGNLYDLIKQEKGNQEGFTTIYCVNDSYEMELYAQLDEHIKNHVDQQVPLEKGAKQTVKYKTSDYFYTPYSFEPILNTTNIHFENRTKKVVNFIPETDFPPPKGTC